MKFMKFLKEYGMWIFVTVTFLVLSGAIFIPFFIRIAREMWQYALS